MMCLEALKAINDGAKQREKEEAERLRKKFSR